MIKTFSEAVKFLERYVPTAEKKYPGELGFLRMNELVSRLGNPHLKYPAIHVGGTSGKGSTATIIASILATRYKVGLHTSPHLMKINERIALISRGPLARSARGPLIREITDEDFVVLVNEIRPYVGQMEKGRYGVPSYFEIVTAMAFLYFAKKTVDVAVIEVGMGGRYDASNVIKPLVAVLTNVGLDHTEVLGETVEEIAKDKIGIIKYGCIVVSGVKQPSVIGIVKKKCEVLKVSLSLLKVPSPRGSLLRLRSGPATPGVSLSPFSYRISKIDSNGSLFDYLGERNYKNLRLSLLGAHQVENAALAIRAVEELSVISYQLSVEEIRKGLRAAYIPARLEIVQRNPMVILDGAHNPDKIRALVEAVKTIWLNRVGPYRGPTLTKTRNVTSIVAIKKDKNAREMLEVLLPICSKFILTQFRGKFDQGELISYTPEELKRIIEAIKATPVVSLAHTVHDAFDQAVKDVDENDIILLTGSLYLVGEMKQIFNSKFEI